MSRTAMGTKIRGLGLGFQRKPKGRDVAVRDIHGLLSVTA